MSLGALVVQIGMYGLTLREVSTIVWAGAIAGNPGMKITLEQMGDKILAGGLIDVLKHGAEKNTISRFLIGAMGIDPDAPPKTEVESGNVQPQTTDGTG